MTGQLVQCKRCGQQVFRRSDGKVLRHTTPARGGRHRGTLWGTFPWSTADAPRECTPAEVCE